MFLQQTQIVTKCIVQRLRWGTFEDLYVASPFHTKSLSYLFSQLQFVKLESYMASDLSWIKKFTFIISYDGKDITQLSIKDWFPSKNPIVWKKECHPISQWALAQEIWISVFFKQFQSNVRNLKMKNLLTSSTNAQGDISWLNFSWWFFLLSNCFLPFTKFKSETTRSERSYPITKNRFTWLLGMLFAPLLTWLRCTFRIADI